MEETNASKKLHGAGGKIIRYVSETLGIIKYKSTEILFHKDFVSFPSNVELPEEFLLVGKAVNFNSECLKFENKTVLVATLVWQKKKPTIYEECSASEYYDYFMENKTVLNNILFDLFSRLAPLQSTEAVLFPLLYLEEVISAKDNIMQSEVLKDMKRCLYMGLTGTIKNYMSNDLLIIQCIIEGQTHSMFFQRCVLFCSRDVSGFSLSTILEVCKTFTVDVEVFIHESESKFFKVHAVNIDEVNIDKLFYSQKYSTDLLSDENNLPSAFVTLQGKACTVSSKIGVIESELSDNIRLFKFKKRNIDLPYDKYHLPLNKCISVQLAVTFSVPHLNDSFATAVFINKKEESFSTDTSLNECTQINSNITFFECQILCVGRVIGHVSFDKGIIMCKILSVDCMLFFHRTHTDIYKTHKNFQLATLFPVDKKVYFNVKTACSGQYLKLDVANVFCVDELVAVVSEVFTDYLSAVLTKEGQTFSIFVSASRFYKDGCTFMTKENNLTHFITVGDKIILEMRADEHTLHHTKKVSWIVYRAQKLNSSNLFSVPQTSVQSFSTHVEKETHVLRIDNAVTVDNFLGNAADWSDSCSVISDTYSENIASSYRITNEVVHDINVAETPIIMDIQQIDLVQNMIVFRYEVLGLEGRVIKYLSNDLGIIACKFNYQLQHILLSRSSLACLSDWSSFPLTAILPLNESFVFDVEVIINEDKSQFLQVKMVKISGKIRQRLVHILEDKSAEISQLHFKKSDLYSFVKLKGKIVSYVTREVGVIEYTLFGTVRHVNFLKKNTHFYGNKSNFFKLLPCGTEVNFCGMLLAPDCLEVSMIWTDKEIENNEMFPFGDILLSPNVNATSFTFQKNVTGTVIGHISNEIGIIKCELLSINCMVQFHKNDTDMFLKKRQLDFMKDFAVGLNVSFNAKILCYEEYFNVRAIQVKKGKNLYKGIVSKVSFQSLEAMLCGEGKQFSVTAPNTRFIYSDNKHLGKNCDLRQFVSVQDELMFEVREVTGPYGCLAWKVYNVQKLDKASTLKEMVQTFQGIVQYVDSECIVVHEKQLGQQKYVREDITLFGVLLTMFNVNELFKQGEVLKFTFCCGEDKLCVGPHHNSLNKDEVYSQLYEYCNRRKFNQHLIDSLIESLNSYYTSEYKTEEKQLYAVYESEEVSLASTQISDKDSVISSVEGCDNNRIVPSNSSICEEEQIQKQNPVNILHTHITNIIKSCIKKKAEENERFRMLQDVNVNNVVQYLEHSVQNSLVNNLLSEIIMDNLIQEDATKTNKEAQVGDIQSDSIKATFPSNVHYENSNIVRDVVHNVSKYLQSSESTYVDKSTQTQSTGWPKKSQRRKEKASPYWRCRSSWQVAAKPCQETYSRENNMC